MRVCILLLFTLLFNSSLFSQSFPLQSSLNCFQIEIEVLNEPFCQGSLNGGQLQANVLGGSGFYTYQWKEDDGGYPPGGPQENQTTLSFLTVGQTYWVIVNDTIQNCVDSASYIFTDYSCQEDTARLDIQSSFDINPVGYSQYTTCDIKLTNLGCQLKFKPEFIISHPTENIELNDFEVEFYNPQYVWQAIPYTINNDGDAIGYWGSQSGETANCDYTQIRPVRVKFNQFNPTAPTGEYTATLRLWSVDDNGNLLAVVSEEIQISLTLADTVCNELNINSTPTDASCPGVYDGQIVLSAQGGVSPYLFSLNNSAYSSNNLFTSLTSGVHYYSVKDSNNCQKSDTVFLNPESVLPDTLWFGSIYPDKAEMYWETNPLADGYKFRYREVGQAWQGPIASGIYANGIAEMNPSKTINGLNPATTYEVQVKVNSLTACEEGWSTEFTFTTPMEVYEYNVDYTCLGDSTGQIYFNVISDNVYTFLWQGPNGFTSTDTSIYQLPEGDYNLQVTNSGSVVFDSTFTILASNISIDLTINNDPSRIIYSPQEQLYFTQTCDVSSYVMAEDGFSNYVWNYGDSLQYIQGQNLLIDTSGIFVQVEALDSNNCIATSDSVHISLVSDFVNLMEANPNEEYIKSTYVLCSADSSVEIDISSFESGNSSIEWREVVGQNTVLISESPQILIEPTQSTNYQLNISNCIFDFHINYFPTLPINIQHSNLVCFGDSNAYIIINTDSSSSITYNVFDSTGQLIYYNESTLPTDTVRNLSAGNYTVKLEDEFLCTVQQEVELLQPDSIYLDSVQFQHIKCFGQELGSMSFKVNGDVNPEIFILSGDTIVLNTDAQGYYTIDSLITSSYTLEVIDENACYHSLNFDINEAELLSLQISNFLDTIACYGDSNSYINALSSGGTPSYTYDLFMNEVLLVQQSESVFNDLTEGNYELFVTDQNGCKDSTDIVIVQNPELTIVEDLSLHQNVLCHGDSTGSLTLIVEGGNFHLDEPSFTFNIDSLKSGYHFPEITDDFGCTASIDSLEITEPEDLILTIDSIQNIDCQTPYGYVEIAFQGGELPYSYSLNAGDTSEVSLVNGALVLENLNEGDYTLTVIDSNLCVDSLLFSIQDLSDFSLSVINISDTLACFGDSTGFVQVSTDVVGNYLYSLYFNDTTLVFQQDTTYFDSLVAGQYGIAVVDDLGCADSVMFEIIEKPLLELTENLQLHQDVLCDGSGLGSITNIITGGTSPYTIGIVNGVTHDYPHQFNNLYVGEYDFIATDFEGCTAELTVEIKTNPISPELILISNQAVDCESLGIVEVELVNGSAPYYFALNGSNVSVTLDTQNKFIISDLAEGDYQLTIIDDFLCRDTLSFEIENTTDIVFEIIDILDTLDCYMDSTGFVELGVENGTSPFTFELIKDGDTLATQSTNTFSNLAVGDYLVTLTDATTCFQQLNFSIVSEDVIISDSLEFHKDVSCYGANDGEFMLNIVSKFSNYLIRLVDSTNTIIYPWENDPHLFTNLSGGIYQTEIVKSVTDDCPYYFELEILEPDSFVLDSFLIKDVVCYGDSSGIFEPFISGGTPQYNFLFNNDSLLTSNNLYADNYYLEITDSNNCTIDTNFTVSQPLELTISTIDTLTLNVSCFGNNNGQIGIEAIGGVPPYQYKINNGALQDSNVLIELVADTFLVSVVDSVGCEDTLTVIISQPDLNLFIDSYQLSDSLGYCSLCYGDSTGFIDITLTGGTPAYSYFMVNNPDTFTSSHIEKLVGGQDYEFFVIDAQGCYSDTIEVECTSPDELKLSLDTAILPSCCYSCDAEVYVHAEGGIKPYSYAFENGTFQSDSLFEQLCGDSAYTFKILDTFNCEKIDSSLVVPNRECLSVDTMNFVNIDSPALIHYDICRVNGTAKIYTTAKEGVGDYSFSIDYQDFIPSNEIMFDSLSQGVHTIIVKDELDCVDTLTFDVLDADPIVISELTVDTIFCGAPTINSATGQSDIGYINAVASGGSSGVYFYSLDSDSSLYQTSGEFTSLDSGFYSMNIIDLNDCIQEFDIYIPYFSASIDYTITDISCPGFMDGMVEVDSVIGGINPWVSLDGNNSNLFTGLQPGNHDISVYYFRPDNNELCNYTESFEIVDKEVLDFFYETTNSSCNEYCDGSISIESATGGTSPYSFICMNTNDTSMNYNALCAEIYAVKMIDSNNCFIIKDVIITEPNPIYPIIDYVDGDLIIIEPTIDNPLSGVPPYSYQWFDNNGEIVGANASSFTASLPGMYSVVVTDNADCVGQSNNYKIEVLGANQWHTKLVDVFPNPFSQKLNIKTYSDNFIDWTINDVRGRVVLSGNNHNSWIVNTSELLNGIYFLRLSQDGNELIYKIIKQ